MGVYEFPGQGWPNTLKSIPNWSEYLQQIHQLHPQRYTKGLRELAPFRFLPPRQQWASDVHPDSTPPYFPIDTHCRAREGCKSRAYIDTVLVRSSWQHSFCLYIIANDSDSNIIVVGLFRVHMEMGNFQFEAIRSQKYKYIGRCTKRG